MISDEPSMNPVSFSMLLSSSRFIASPAELRNVGSKFSNVLRRNVSCDTLLSSNCLITSVLYWSDSRIVYEWRGIPGNWGYNSMMNPSYRPTETQPGRETKNLPGPWDLSISIEMMDDNRQFLQRNALKAERFNPLLKLTGRHTPGSPHPA